MKLSRWSYDEIIPCGCILFALLLVPGLFLWKKHDDDMWKNNRAIAGPAYLQSQRLVDRMGHALQWKVCSSEKAPDDSGTNVTISRGNNTEKFLLTPTNKYHRWIVLKEGNIVEIKMGPYPYGRIFSPNVCDYIVIDKDPPPAPQ